jgi:hypothetical protein
MNEKIEVIIKEAEKMGFSVVAKLDCSTLELKQEVRDMCAANTCGMYGKNWSALGLRRTSECKDNVDSTKSDYCTDG